MAANYWASTQRRHWCFSREKLAEAREKLRERDTVSHTQYPLPDTRLLNIYFSQREIYNKQSNFFFSLLFLFLSMVG